MPVMVMTMEESDDNKNKISDESLLIKKFQNGPDF